MAEGTLYAHQKPQEGERERESEQKSEQQHKSSCRSQDEHRIGFGFSLHGLLVCTCVPFALSPTQKGEVEHSNTASDNCTVWIRLYGAAIIY